MFYGKIGFFQFLINLFGPIKKDDKTKSFNFYFSMRKIMGKLAEYDKRLNEFAPQPDGVFATTKWKE